MNIKILFNLLTVIFIFSLGALSTYFFLEKWTPKTVIEKEDIKYNTVEKDISQMTDTEKECFYKGIPTLDIENTDGNNYLLSAGLCSRAWTRKVNLSPNKNKNAIIGNVIINSKLTPGLSFQYFHLFNGCLGIGGGLALFKDLDFQISGGALFAW